jgi:uncharacterized protein (DUF427 family)
LMRDGPRRMKPSNRRVRAIFNGATIVDTTRAVHVWEHDYFPQFYVPEKDLINCTWSNGEKRIVKGHDEQELVAYQITIVVSGDGQGRKSLQTDRVLRIVTNKGSSPSTDDNSGSLLGGLVRIEFGSIGRFMLSLFIDLHATCKWLRTTYTCDIDQWLEEDVPIYVHPKDPYKRIDLLPSTRPIEVRIKGRVVAKASFAVHLHETGLPVRYYIPLMSVDQSVLRPSSTITKCPYKGEAEYYHVDVGNGDEPLKDVVWYYRFPIPECAAVAGLVCFYNEKVDIQLDEAS